MRTLNVFRQALTDKESNAPYACLIVADVDGDQDARLDELRQAIAQGARYFVIFGSKAALVEGRVDEILEDAGLMEGMTTSHTDEDFEDVLNFVRHGGVLPQGESDVGVVCISEADERRFLSELTNLS